MRKINLLFLLIPAACSAASYTASQSGNWNSSATWGGAGVPGFGDTAVDNQYVVTCPAGVTCNLGTINTTSLNLGDGSHSASLIINGTFVLRGQGALNGAPADCLNSPAVIVGTGGTLDLDENGGSYASGFVIPSGTEPCTRFVLGTAGDVCTWTPGSVACPTNVASVNNGTANGILLLDSGNGAGDAITNWNGVAVTACGPATTAVAGCYQVEMDRAQSSWNWEQVYLNGDGSFGANPGTGTNGDVPITIDSVMSASRLSGTDIDFGTFCTHGAYAPAYIPACSSPRYITNSLLKSMRYDGANGIPDTAGITIRNVYLDGLGSYYNNLTAAHIAGGSWSYVLDAEDAATCSENVPTNNSILAPSADHVYALCTATAGIPAMIYIPSDSAWGTTINLSNFIFDNETTAFGNNGHCLNYGGGILGSQSGYAVNLSYMTVLSTQGQGFAGCEFTAWSAGCPAGPSVSVTHLLQQGGPVNGSIYFCEGDSSVAVAPALALYEGNIYWDTSARNNPLWFGDSSTSFRAAQPANVVNPTDVDYNVNLNYIPFVTTPFTKACAAGCTNSGSAYAVPMTGSSPGAHDQNVNPALLDSTRSAYTWAATRGQAATAGGLRQVFLNGGPSNIGANINALFYYINQGNMPTRSLWNALPDGTTIGPAQPVMFPRDIRTVTR